MDEKLLNPLRERTDSKLRYAEVHLKELTDIPILAGDDFDRAHQESFLFHLIGTKDAFIQELNVVYGANLPERELTLGKLRSYMKEHSKPYTELTTLYSLEVEEKSWLNQAREMRDHSTHISNVSRAYHLGGEFDQQVHLRNPKTGEKISIHFLKLFEEWLLNMKMLILELRKSSSENSNF